MIIKVFLVHGFNVYDGGAGSIGRLEKYFQDRACLTELMSYGHFNLFAPRWRNRKIAKHLTRKVKRAANAGNKVIVAAHSNGCTITHIAGKLYNAPIDKAIYINPALDKDVRLPASILALDVWHSPSDKPVKWSRLLPFHPWGEMGSIGAIRHDERVRNFNKQTNFSLSSKAHSDVFSDDLVPYFGPIIVNEGLQRI